MTEAQNGLPKSRAEPGAQDPALDDGLSVAGADGESHGGFSIDTSGELGSNLLLSRSVAPQGRKSLFRR